MLIFDYEYGSSKPGLNYYVLMNGINPLTKQCEGP